MYALIPSFTSRGLAAFGGTPSGNSARRTSSDVYRRRTSVRVVFTAERLPDSRDAFLVALPGNSAFLGAVNTSTISRRSRALASLDLYGYSHRAEAAQAETTDLDGQHQEGVARAAGRRHGHLRLCAIPCAGRQAPSEQQGASRLRRCAGGETPKRDMDLIVDRLKR